MDPLSSVRALDPAKRASSLFNEFKAFAFKGHVIDLAVGVIIGAAFGKIVDSLVKQIKDQELLAEIRDLLRHREGAD